jgi:triphosphatase
MAHEIELKLNASAEAAARLLKAPWLEKLVSVPLEPKRVASVYFDTHTNKLRAAGISLRVRRIGDKYVQTVKRDPKGACGAFTRQEWEWEIAGDEPDLSISAARTTAVAPASIQTASILPKRLM